MVTGTVRVTARNITFAERAVVNVSNLESERFKSFIHEGEAEISFMELIFLLCFYLVSCDNLTLVQQYFISFFYFVSSYYRIS